MKGIDLKNEIKLEKEIEFYKNRMLASRTKMYRAREKLNKIRNPHLFFDKTQSAQLVL